MYGFIKYREPFVVHVETFILITSKVLDKLNELEVLGSSSAEEKQVPKSSKIYDFFNTFGCQTYPED